MAISIKHTYTKNEVTSWKVPNISDVFALLVVMALLVIVGLAAKGMLGSYHIGQAMPISLSPTKLPYYAARSVLRMLIALVCSFVFTLVFGTWAAKSRQAERVIIPLIDILQSVPVLGYLSITVVAFVVFFKGSMLGPECAAIFAIFTAQVWNMTLSFYQSLRTVPDNLIEASLMFQLSPWQRFWKIEVPFATPALLWNAMMSMSGSWVFLVASEAITVAHRDITLPGLGSYIALAVARADSTAIWYVLIAMFIVIAIYDQLLFRPLVAWAEKFKTTDVDSEEVPESWLLNLFQRGRFFQWCIQRMGVWVDAFVNLKFFRLRLDRRQVFVPKVMSKMMLLLWNLLLIALVFAAIVVIAQFIFQTLTWQDGLHVVYFGCVTAVRIFVVVFVSALIWVPIGVMVGFNPRASQIVQPIAQFFAAFPVNLLFPVAAFLILKYHLNINIWCSPLMILGTQWYILFNVIAGASALPIGMRQAVSTLNVRGWLWWRKLALPAIFPYLVTGAITAAGGAWNISIVAEVIEWGQHNLVATGLGSYVTQVSHSGDFPALTLGISVMSLFVIVINRLIWKPLYNLAQQRYQIR